LGRYSILLVVLGSILWGTDSLFRRPLTQQLSPTTIVFLEHVILVVVMAPLLFGSRGEISKLDVRDWIALGFIAVGGSVAATVLFTYSIKFGNPSVTVLLQKTQPLCTIFLARWLLRERPSPWLWYCLAPALAGAYLVSTPDWRTGLGLDPRRPMSIVAALGASALWGASTVLGRFVIARMKVLVLTGLRFLVALPVLTLLFWLQPTVERKLPETLEASGAVVMMALIPGLAALVIYYRGLQSTMASLASIGEMAFPITAVTANWILLSIRLTASQFVGAAILVASVTVLTFFDAREKSRPHAQKNRLRGKQP